MSHIDDELKALGIGTFDDDAQADAEHAAAQDDFAKVAKWNDGANRIRIFPARPKLDDKGKQVIGPNGKPVFAWFVDAKKHFIERPDGVTVGMTCRATVGEDCIGCHLYGQAMKLAAGDEGATNKAKKMRAGRKYYVLAVRRGEEALGVQGFAFSPKAFKALLAAIKANDAELDEDERARGERDWLHPVYGRDVTVTKGKGSNGFDEYSVALARRATPFMGRSPKEAIDAIKAAMTSLPDINLYVEVKTDEQVREALQLKAGPGSKALAPASHASTIEGAVTRGHRHVDPPPPDEEDYYPDDTEGDTDFVG